MMKMRRKEREVTDAAKINAVIDSCDCCGEKPGANRIRLAGRKSCASTAMRVMTGFGCKGCV